MHKLSKRRPCGVYLPNSSFQNTRISTRLHTGPAEAVRNAETLRITSSKDKTTSSVQVSPPHTPYSPIQSSHPLARTKRFLRALENISRLSDITNAEATEQPSSHYVERQPSLPLSPLMDPKRIKRRSRRNQPKDPADPTTDFEKTIAMNPFALMLASHPRMDSITEARVPSAFLRPFTLRADPSSEAIWQLPKDLDPSPLEAVNLNHTTSNEPEPKSHNARLADEVIPSWEKDLATCWVASTNPAMDHMSGGVRSTRDLLKRKSSLTTTPRWRTLPGSVLSKIAIRTDNAAFIHDLLRKTCARKLASLTTKDREQDPAPIASWSASVDAPIDAMKSIEERLRDMSPAEEPATLQNGVLLWMGDDSIDASRLAQQKERIFGSSENPIHDPLIRLSHGRTVPVLDAESLLGADCLGWLRSQSAMFQQATVVVKQTLYSNEALAWLWKLRLY